ncbi:7718_t:CDS:2, partial [Funneliformis geosporum]
KKDLEDANLLIKANDEDIKKQTKLIAEINKSLGNIIKQIIARLGLLDLVNEGFSIFNDRGDINNDKTAELLALANANVAAHKKVKEINKSLKESLEEKANDIPVGSAIEG